LSSSKGAKRDRDGETKSHDPLQRSLLRQDSFAVGEITRVQLKEMLNSLEKTTHFNATQLQEIVEFVKRETRNGIVDHEAFVKAMNAIGIKDLFVIEQYYNAFDADKNGQIDIQEFIHGLSVILKGSPTERLRLMFNAYDLDGNGSLDKEELANMFRVSTRASGKEINEKAIKNWVSEILAIRSPENMGEMTFDEFNNAIQSKQLSFHELFLK